MTTYAELWNRIEKLSPRQRDDLIEFMNTRVDHDSAQKHVIREFEKRVPKNGNPTGVRKALELAIGSRHKQWKDLARVADGEMKQAEKNAAARSLLTKSFVETRKRLNVSKRELATVKAAVDLLKIDHRMPDVPVPEKTAAQWAAERDVFAGVYIAFGSCGEAVYVGESCDIFSRLRSHNVVHGNELVAVIQTKPHERFFAEVYYIWLLKPARNREGKKTIRVASGRRRN